MRAGGALLPLLAAACAGSACASQPQSPFFGDDRYLVLGVDPAAESSRVAEQLEKSGYRVARTLRGQHFTALGAEDGEGPARVRVITARGIGLALDASSGDALRPGTRYALLAPPSRETHDADGDGFEEVFVEVRIEHMPACIRAYRVRDSGFVDLVTKGVAIAPQPNMAPPWNSPQFCDEEEEEAPEAPVEEPAVAPTQEPAPQQQPAAPPQPAPPAPGGASPPGG